MDKGQILRVVLTLLILFLAGWFGGEAARAKDVLMFTAVWVLALIGVLIVRVKLGPIQRADERMVRRSEEAALLAVRINLVVGAIGSAYAAILGLHQAASLLGFAAAIPTIIWIVAYWILNWRDVA